jgi:hypothetical protein
MAPTSPKTSTSSSGPALVRKRRDLDRIRPDVLGLLDPVGLEDVDVERIDARLVAAASRLDVVALGAELERKDDEEPRQRRVREHRRGEVRESHPVVAEVTAERMAARILEDDLRAPEELLMLDLLVAEAEQGAEPRAVVVPAALDDACSDGAGRTARSCRGDARS